MRLYRLHFELMSEAMYPTDDKHKQAKLGIAGPHLGEEQWTKEGEREGNGRMHL